MLGNAFGIELCWIPLGAGGNFVRLSGRIYEAILATIQRRPRCELYHSALVIGARDGRYTIEQTPAGPHAEGRGVVGIGPVFARWAARLRVFRYELRRWRGGVIPDLDEAVDSPQLLSSDPAVAEKLLGLAPQVPFFAWGRDELRVGDMWDSNSQIAWLIARTGLDAESIKPPRGGRAPGWHAGLVAATRHLTWQPETFARDHGGKGGAALGAKLRFGAAEGTQSVQDDRHVDRFLEEGARHRGQHADRREDHSHNR